jgi:site-specific DNA recombinase
VLVTPLFLLAQNVGSDGRARPEKDVKAALYIRVSTDDQAEHGHSMEAQEARLREFCDHHGHEVVGVYADGGVSGTIPFAERPEGGRLLADRVRLGTQLVLAVKTDRIGRSLIGILRVHQDMERLGVILRALDAPADTTTPEGRMMLQITGAFAEHERNRIVDRTKTALARMKARGLRTGGIPYGSRLAPDGVHLEPDPEEQRVVEMVRELHNGGISYRALAVYLEGAGIEPRGESWHKTTVAGIFHGTRKPKTRRVASGYVRVRPMDMERLRGLYAAGMGSSAIAAALAQDEARVVRALDAIDEPERLQEQQAATDVLKRKGWSYDRIAEHWGVSRAEVKDVVDGVGVISARAWRARKP